MTAAGSMPSGVEHANFFEQRDRIFEGRDQGQLERRVGRLRQEAEGKISSGAGPAANEDVSEEGGDVFSRAGVAAE